MTAMHRPGTPSPENCPEPYWHETHNYCPACTWVRDTGPSRAELVDVLIAQVQALLVVVRNGGDVRTANLDDRLFTDRLQDTLNALKAG